MALFFELQSDIFARHVPKLDMVLPDEINFLSGHFISLQIASPLIFNTRHSLGDPPKAFHGRRVPVMSAELRGFLAGCGVDNIQYFPAQLISRSDGTVWDNYFAVNIIGVVAAADLKASEYTTVIDRPGSSGLPLVAFEDLKIDPNRAQGLNLFRLAESPSVIIISEALVQRLRSAKTDRDWGLTLDSR